MPLNRDRFGKEISISVTKMPRSLPSVQVTQDAKWP